MKTIEAPKVDEKMIHDPFKKKKEKKTVIAKKGGWIKDAIKNKKFLSPNPPRNNKRK